MKKLVASLLFIIALGMVTTTVLAQSKATIRIEPHAFDPPDPMVLSSPATFLVNVTNENDNPTNSPNIMLVMTQACYNGLSGNVAVAWTGGSINFTKSDFTYIDSDKAIFYTAASLADHLGVSGQGVYWANKPFLSGPITTTPQPFTVTITSTATKMLVYAIGKTGSSSEFNNRVPQTRPGLVVPELVPALMTIASFTAFGLYALKRRKA